MSANAGRRWPAIPNTSSSIPCLEQPLLRSAASPNSCLGRTAAWSRRRCTPICISIAPSCSASCTASTRPKPAIYGRSNCGRARPESGSAGFIPALNNRADEALTLVHNIARRPIGVPERNFSLAEAKAKALASRDPALIRNALEGWDQAAQTGTGFAEMRSFSLPSSALPTRRSGLSTASISEPRLHHARRALLTSRRPLQRCERNTFFLFWEFPRASAEPPLRAAYA